MKRIVLAAVLVAGCGPPVARFPSDVQAALARDDMRRLETAQLLVYYPAGRRALAERMATRIEMCATEARLRARVDNRHSREKMIVVVPDAPFNNAFVMPPAAGLQDVAVVPAQSTLDFATSFGLPPDPGMVGCHEIIHYVQVKQIAGFWGAARTVLGDLLSPQIGLDPWFLEGLATHYEAQLQPGVGRPRWPVFTGMFHAAYAGGAGLVPGELSEQQRRSPFGHHYLVGSMFIEFLAQTYGDAPLWRVIEAQASSASVIFSVNGRFHSVYGRGVSALFDEFRTWVAQKYPVRARPAHERVVRTLGSDARWAWGPNGEVAVIDADVDAPARLRIWDAAGAPLEELNLVTIAPPRRQVIAAPLLISGMSFADDGTLWFTSVDLGGTFQTTRLYCWSRGEGLRRLTSGLGPGGAITPDGSAYLHMDVDGDRWSLAAHPVAGGPGRVVWQARPGQYALRVAPSPDGARLALSVWDGARFAVWVLDAATGARLATHASALGTPLYDPSWTPDGRLMMLEVVDGRFQVAIAAAGGSRTVYGDAPYGSLEARARGDAIRFLARDGWRYTLDEIPLPAATGAEVAPAAESSPEPAPTTAPATVALSDRPYSHLDGLFRPSLHSISFALDLVHQNRVGLSLGGGDRLDLIRWSGDAVIEPATKRVSFNAGLLFNDLAPWQVALGGTRLHVTERRAASAPETEPQPEHELRRASGLIGRVWRGTWLAAAGGTYASDRVTPADDEVGFARVFGPFLSLAYSAIESTAYTGPRRGLALALDGAQYRRLVDGQRSTLRDVRGQLDVFVPVPYGRRHVWHATVRGRALLDGPPLLQIGGWSPVVPLASYPDEDLEAGPVASDALPDGLLFAEPLRGFEDLGFVVERAVLGELSWRYPLIIDRGRPTLLFLPAGFVRQLDVELFLSAAAFRPDPTTADLHAAGGAALTLRLTFLRIPFFLRYQGSQRFTDDRSWLHLGGLGADL